MDDTPSDEPARGRSDIPEPKAALRRIVVIGPIASGKTTLAATLGTSLGINHIELDDLYWMPGWRPRTDEDFKYRVRAALEANERWVICGNFIDSAQHLIWPHASSIIWLDYPLRVRLFRNIRRSWGRHRENQREKQAANASNRLAATALSPILGGLPRRGRAILTDLYVCGRIASEQFEVVTRFVYWRRFFAGQLADPRWTAAERIRLATPRDAERFASAVAGAATRPG